MNDIYYYKYIKYKIKYLILKGGSLKRSITHNLTDDIILFNNIHILFNNREKIIYDDTTKELILKNTIEQCQIINNLPKRTYIHRDAKNNVTYYGKKDDNDTSKELILKNTIEQCQIIKNLPKRPYIHRDAKNNVTYYGKKDDNYVNEDDNDDNDDNEDVNDEDVNDEDYKYVNENENFYQQLGKIIELYISVYNECPCCKSRTLSPYTDSNMPIIDLICININHKGVKYFQVKSTINMNNNINNRTDYFTNYSSDNIQIRISNINKGKKKAIHSITPNSEYKELAIGYIGIKYSWDNDNNKIIIDKLKSFIVLPNIEINSNEPYYNIMDNDIIKVNENVCSINNFKDSDYFQNEINLNPFFK